MSAPQTEKNAVEALNLHLREILLPHYHPCQANRLHENLVAVNLKLLQVKHLWSPALRKLQTIIAAPLPEPVFVNPIKFSFPNWLLKVKSFLIKIVFHLFPLKTLVNLISRTKLITFALQSAYFRSISNDTPLKRIVTVPARRINASKALRAMCIGMSNRPNSAQGPSIIEKIKNLPNRPPILLIWGKQDKLIPIFLAKKLIKLHPWLKLTVINDAGHCLHDELPKIFNQIVISF